MPVAGVPRLGNASTRPSPADRVRQLAGEITGQPTDGGETDLGWTYEGFARTDGTITKSFLNLYLAEYRAYTGYDQALEVGPYNFTDPNGNFVEHFPYQDGLLVWYYDGSQNDNNVSEHPGEGLILPIDANPTIGHWSDSSVARPRIQSYDATFGVAKTDAITLHSTVFGTYTQASQPAVRVFDDANSYYVASDPADGSSTYKAGWNSVNHPHSGTKIRVVNVSGNGGFMQIQVN
jgi:immune inhibitor A